jgi:membrane glycosyltransferase
MDAGVTFPPLPAEAPLAMPTQSLRRAPKRVGGFPSSPRAMGLRRLLVIGGAIVMTAFGAREMYRVLAVNGATPLAIFMLALFVASFRCWPVAAAACWRRARCRPAAPRC